MTARIWWPAAAILLIVSSFAFGASFANFLLQGAAEPVIVVASADPPFEGESRADTIRALAEDYLSRDPPSAETEEDEKPSGVTVAAAVASSGTKPASARIPRPALRRSIEAYQAIERAIQEQAYEARVVIEIERKMQVARAYTASLIIQGGTGFAAAEIAKSTPEPIAADFAIEIAPDATASATSGQFDIQPITPERQTNRGKAPTVWRWSVVPRGAGEASMMFILLQNVRIGGEMHLVPVKQFPHTITVELTWFLWAHEMALSFWGGVTAFLVAGASAATIYSSMRKQDAGPSAQKPRPRPRTSKGASKVAA